MLVLIYDTETSGLPLFTEPSESEGQPHICEIAALLFDDHSKVLHQSLHHIVRQDGWDVDEKAFEAHGITKERSFSEGIDEAIAVQQFYALSLMSDVRVAHNEQFDQRIIRIGMKRFALGESQEMRDNMADTFKARPSYCTMKTATPILNLPATETMVKAGRGKWKKSPSLMETYRHFFGQEFEGAHGALADAKACARIYFKMTQDHDIGFLP
jgi:DNA polymerase-3 subunit epsilon